MLMNPDCPDSELILKEDYIECSLTGKKFHIKNEMVDFINNENTNTECVNSKPKNVLFKLNELFNQNFEQKISGSIFAVSGLGTSIMRNKMRSWLSLLHVGVILDVGCGDKKWEKYIPDNCKYLPLDHLTISLDSPWRISYPQINADATKLPFRSNSIDSVINIFVLEHTKSPTLLIQELTRVIKPGGFLLIVGPGDILMTHGEPNFYFNMSKHAYSMLLKENNMEILDEYFPSKFWMSLFTLTYEKIVRNDIYNKNSIMKLLQLPVFFLSLIFSPIANLIAYIFDLITPFDQRGYNIYMVFSRKKTK